jgi:hypothetical protein
MCSTVLPKLPRLDTPLPLRSGRTYGDFVVEALVLSHVVREMRSDLTVRQLVYEIACDLDEEDNSRAELAVHALIEDGFLVIERGFVHLAIDPILSEHNMTRPCR